MATTATLKVTDAPEFWRVARRLHAIYSELDHTFELGLPRCPDLEDSVDREEPEVMDRVRLWFDTMDTHIQVWQLRQLLQSTGLQNEENLRYLIVRHLERAYKTEGDKEKIDFLLVQYFAHCAPHGMTEHQVTLDEVGRVLEPALGVLPEGYPEWAPALDDKLVRLNGCNSLEELQNSGVLLEVRELKLAVGDQYFEPGFLVAFTRFNFRARRAFFKAMHIDLHAIRSSVNDLEELGFTSIDCREAGMTENESLDQVRHVVHQWKTPFRAPYSGGSSFLQLILLRHCLQQALSDAHANGAPAIEEPPAPEMPESVMPAPVVVDHDPVQVKGEVVGAQALEPMLLSAMESSFPQKPAPVSQALSSAATTEHTSAVAQVAIRETPEVISGAVSSEELSEEQQYLEHCVADIKEQLLAFPAKHTPSVSAIHLGGCKLLIATWEAEAFTNPQDIAAETLQRTVAARTILHVCTERQRKGEPTDLSVALKLARTQIEEMEQQVVVVRDAHNIDAAVNLAATSKRLISLIEEAEKLLA
jgi:hypothetical protein